jgi:hypothetical protein
MLVPPTPPPMTIARACSTRSRPPCSVRRGDLDRVAAATLRRGPVPRVDMSGSAQWQIPEPLSVKVELATGTNRQS